MATTKMLAGLSAAALLAACGSADNEIQLTNTDNVILNDAQANFQFRNDEPPPEPDTAMNGMEMDNAMEGNSAGLTGNLTS